MAEGFRGQTCYTKMRLTFPIVLKEIEDERTALLRSKEKQEKRAEVMAQRRAARAQEKENSADDAEESEDQPKARAGRPVFV